MPKPYDKTTYDGNTVDWLTRAALEATAKRLGYADGLTITQGSYNAGGVAASSGTHDGGGVVDLAPFDHVAKVRELRRTGFAAWYRPAIPGLWPAHIHAVLIGNAKLAPSARRQVSAYLARRDGLAGNGPDNGPRDFVNRRYRWRRGEKRINRARDLLARARAQLAHGTRGYAVRPALKAIGVAYESLPKAG
jgi:hypothetical protein